MIPREMIVPFRKFTLQESVAIIQAATNPKQYVWKGSRPPVEKVEQWQEWLEACLTQTTKRLTKWEEGFLTSIQDQLTYVGSLSEKQVEILERIYTEKV